MGKVTLDEKTMLIRSVDAARWRHRLGAGASVATLLSGLTALGYSSPGSLQSALVACAGLSGLGFTAASYRRRPLPRLLAEAKSIPELRRRFAEMIVLHTVSAIASLVLAGLAIRHFLSGS